MWSRFYSSLLFSLPFLLDLPWPKIRFHRPNKQKVWRAAIGPYRCDRFPGRVSLGTLGNGVQGFKTSCHLRGCHRFTVANTFLREGSSSKQNLGKWGCAEENYWTYVKQNTQTLRSGQTDNRAFSILPRCWKVHQFVSRYEEDAVTHKSLTRFTKQKRRQ